MPSGGLLPRTCSFGLGAVMAFSLAACDETTLTGAAPSAPGQEASLPPEAPTKVSEESRALARHYAALQRDLLTRGLLRRDGGGPDTPFTPDDLARNFETIAFFDEYARGGGIGTRSAGVSGRLRRWSGPVRIATEFGTSPTAARRRGDAATIDRYAARLERLTGHPISTVQSGGNFHVLVMSIDDNKLLQTRLRAHVPNIGESTLSLFRNLPRTVHCLVVAFADSGNTETYTKAVALIRAEHPDLLRLSCIHEEIAQGLGLANDSPDARPSIFNDDDEFALLTTHDEMLLKILYSPQLRPGMRAEEARPIVVEKARELMGMGPV